MTQEIIEPRDLRILGNIPSDASARHAALIRVVLGLAASAEKKLSSSPALCRSCAEMEATLDRVNQENQRLEGVVKKLEAALELEAIARWQMTESLHEERRLPSPSRPMLATTPEEIRAAIKARSPFHPVPTPLEHDALRAHELADELQRVARNTPEALSFGDPDEQFKGWTVYGSQKALDALDKKLKKVIEGGLR